MGRRETVELTNMCMVYDHQGNILVQERLDPEWPGVTFPGGHVEKGEPFTKSVIREVREETGLTIQAPKLCGLKQFFDDDGTRFIVLLYKSDRFSGKLCSSEEGRVFWIKRCELGQYQLPVGFEQMIHVFEDDEIGEQYVHLVNDEVVRELL